jgi:hypothetical protein
MSINESDIFEENNLFIVGDTLKGNILSIINGIENIYNESLKSVEPFDIESELE